MLKLPLTVRFAFALALSVAFSMGCRSASNHQLGGIRPVAEALNLYGPVYESEHFEVQGCGENYARRVLECAEASRARTAKRLGVNTTWRDAKCRIIVCQTAEQLTQRTRRGLSFDADGAAIVERNTDDSIRWRRIYIRSGEDLFCDWLPHEITHVLNADRWKDLDKWEEEKLAQSSESESSQRKILGRAKAWHQMLQKEGRQSIAWMVRHAEYPTGGDHEIDCYYSLSLATLYFLVDEGGGGPDGWKKLLGCLDGTKGKDGLSRVYGQYGFKDETDLENRFARWMSKR